MFSCSCHSRISSNCVNFDVVSMTRALIAGRLLKSMTQGKVRDLEFDASLMERIGRARGVAHGHIKIAIVIDDAKCRSTPNLKAKFVEP